MPKLDRLARSVPDARSIADELAARGITLTLGQSRYDPADPIITVASSTYNLNFTNLILNATSLFPEMLGTAAMPLTVLNDVGGMAGGFITNNIMAPMLRAILGNTIDDGDGHTIPTPDAACVASGTC